MSIPRETTGFAAALALLLAVFFHESLFLGRVLSPADVVFVQQTFDGLKPDGFEPLNRLLMDPVLQFEPWLEFNRAELRAGRIPLWNPYAGCGAPHLANGQSAVFDPFHLIAYLGPLPQAHGWLAAARLWVAGFGVFLLARRWGLGPWGRWFAGLTFPFCGFLVGWLLYPVTNSAVWLPWLIWATDRLLERTRAVNAALLALVTGCSIFGGHIQTTAHALIATGLYAIWWVARGAWVSELGCDWKRCAVRLVSFAGAVGLGIGLAGVQVLPLGAYLTRSPVWQDRERERPDPLVVTRPRVLDAVCTALPYAYGSQRRGQPNLARALGVHNVNESAGGFTSLATLLVLAPLGWRMRRVYPTALFCAWLAIVGALLAFEIPPLINLTRLLPVINVIDHRRLTLWVAFGVVALGAYGIDQLGVNAFSRRPRWLMLLVAAGLIAGAVAVPMARPWMLVKSHAHYGAALGAESAEAAARAMRQVEHAMAFLPGYYALAAGQLFAILALIVSHERGWLNRGALRGGVFSIALLDVFAFGYGVNPAIARADYHPNSDVIKYLRKHAELPYRVVAVGEEMPPNLLMRYGIADCRNYDSVELASALDWLEPLFEVDTERGARTSRREVTWEGVLRCQDRLRRALVRFAVGATPPPPELMEHAQQRGPIWLVDLQPDVTNFAYSSPAKIRIDASGASGDRVVVPIAYDAGWQARVGGDTAVRVTNAGGLLALEGKSVTRGVTLSYDPVEFRIGLIATLFASVCLAFVFLQEAWNRVVRKNDPGAWRPESASDRIGAVRSHFFDLSRRLSTEGRDTDGPLHV